MGKLKAIKEAVEAAGRRLDDYATRVVYHGSPHDFDAFDLNKIGTGEGAQAYGHGLYFTESKKVAKHYRENLSNYPSNINPEKVLSPKEGTTAAKFYDLFGSPDVQKVDVEDAVDVFGEDVRELADSYGDINVNELAKKIGYETGSGVVFPDASVFAFTDDGGMWNAGQLEGFDGKGRLYRAEIPTADYMLDWDKPLSEQPEAVRKALNSDPMIRDAFLIEGDETLPNMKGSEIYSILTNRNGWGDSESVGRAMRPVSEHLKNLGIVGINYVGDSSGVRNAVVFDDQLIRVLEKGGADPKLLAALAAGSAGAIAAGRELSQPEDFPGDPGLPALDPRYAEFARRREAKRDTWRQLKESVFTLGSAVGGGIVGDLSRLGGYLNPLMPVEQTEQGAQAIENAIQYRPTGPNRYLEWLGRGIEQAQEDFAPLTDQIPGSIPGRIYNALPDRMQGLARILADFAL